MELKYMILIIGGTMIFSLLVIFIIAFILIYQKRYYRHVKEKQLLQSQFAQALLQSQIEIQEQTLQHLSRELHDNLGQVASLIKINLNTLALSNLQKAAEKIEGTKDLTRQLIADIKSLSVSLNSDRISQVGLVKAIETEVDRLNKTEQFEASLVLTGTAPEIDKDKSVILYRMAQEILNNIVKHSQAACIKVSLQNSGNQFKMIFSDNGVGFNPAEKTMASGAGLRNLTNRAAMINAQLTINSSPGSGTQTVIELLT